MVASFTFKLNVPPATRKVTLSPHSNKVIYNLVTTHKRSFFLIYPKKKKIYKYIFLQDRHFVGFTFTVQGERKFAL
jgi:hypothetical protein